MQSSFNTFTAAKKPIVDDWIQQHIKASTKAGSGHAYNELVSEIETLVGRGGKRLRPLLFMAAYQAYDGNNHESVVPIACAIELLHTYFLIHDDIIDRDMSRWRGHNISGVYFERYSAHQRAPEALHYAQAQALLAGDICNNLAIDALLQAPLQRQATLAVLQLFTASTRHVLDGELSDVAFSRDRLERLPTSEAVLSMYRRKTAHYSFVLPLQLGAIAASAPATEQSTLSEIGREIGMAYQMQDDVIGLFGEEVLTGKPQGSDLREGRPTYLFLKALELVSVSVKTRLLANFGDATVTAADLRKARDIIVGCGAKAAIEEQAARHITTGRQLLKTTSMTNSGKQLLDSAIHYVLERTH